MEECNACGLQDIFIYIIICIYIYIIRIQEFNRLVQSCPIVIIELRYHNSSLLRHGTRLQVIHFDFETMCLRSGLS